MSDTAASFDDVALFGGRGFAFGDVRGLLGRVLGTAAMGVAAMAAVGACAATVAVTGLWVVGVTLSGTPHGQARRPSGPARLALADSAAFPKSSFEARWAITTAVMPLSARVAAHSVDSGATAVGKGVSELPATSYPHLKSTDEGTPAPTRAAKVTLPATSAPQSRVVPQAPTPVVTRAALVPLPRPKHVRPSIAQRPPELPAPQIAPVATAPVLSGTHSGTALYDITGRTVYMPNGERLEAHSGLGDLRDNPRYFKVKNRGPTPPNVYKLTLRERLFHGVRAVRMTPEDESKMFGRDGMLAHSYMLGSSGQSNGCVSFKDYDRFLEAFLKGEVDRIVVVRSLDEAPRQLASLVHGRDDNRYAANEVTGSTW